MESTERIKIIVTDETSPSDIVNQCMSHFAEHYEGHLKNKDRYMS